MSSRAEVGTHDKSESKARAPQPGVAERQPPQQQQQQLEPSHPARLVGHALLKPHTLNERRVLQLQRTLGNRAVGRIFQQGAQPQVASPALQIENEHAHGETPQPVQRKANTTGLPDALKAGIESLAGLSLDDVNVHMHSDKPARVQAVAYTQGSDIHVGEGGEKHLAHEAWHVVQQRQGRVQPTLRAGDVAINDDLNLEREADVMGERALRVPATQVASPPVGGQGERGGESDGAGEVQSAGSLAPASATQRKAAAAPVIQRALRIGLPGHYHWYTDPDDIRDAAFDQLGANALSIENLAAMGNDGITHGYDTWAAAIAATEHSDDPLALVNVDEPVARPVSEIVAHMNIGALRIEREFTQADLEMFKLGPDRQPLTADTPETGTEKYGYHLTKLHNLPGIKTTGLDPAAGASKRGSVAMSTEEQRVGSIKTSTGVVAFGLQPSTFRPYINQYEDRRQMIEAAPIALKPVMLRFDIEAAIGRENVGYDFMDASARNTKRAILPQFLEVLTPTGWVPITRYRFDTPLVEHRSGNDNARTGLVWKGKKIIMTWSEMNDAMPGSPFANLDKLFAAKPAEAIALLEASRDKVIGKYKNITYTFRGASMQTSGHPKNWEYAFTVESAAKLPDWIERYHVRYLREYESLSAAQIEEYRKFMATQ